MFWDIVTLAGQGHFRCQTIPMRTDIVESMLPYGFTLGPQRLTPEGTHPVVMFFQEMIRAHMTIPAPLPNMTYHEQLVGIPYTRVPGILPWMPSGAGLGPFFYMPRLYLSDVWPVVGGQLYWGFNKQMANFSLTESQWTVLGEDGRKIIEFEHRPPGSPQPWLPVSDRPYPNLDWFSGPDGLMVQPLISQVPMGYQIFPVASNFDKFWSQAYVRPLLGRVSIYESFVPTLPTGVFPGAHWAPSIADSPFGCFELLAPWRLTMPYPPEWTSFIPPKHTADTPSEPVVPGPPG